MTVSFTLQGYEKMLKTFLDMGYQFKLFPKQAKDVEKTGVIYLRHDVDIDPWPSLYQAEIESRLDIKASYFFMLDNPAYNLFSEPHKTVLWALKEKGHYVGPHIEPHHSSFYATADRVRVTSELFEEHFTAHDRAWIFSYHWGTRRQPAHVLGKEPSGRIHTYLPAFTKDIGYVSDSEGKWKHGDPLERAKANPGKSMQILIHPEWWGEWECEPKQRLSNLRSLIIDRIDEYFDEDIFPGEWI